MDGNRRTTVSDEEGVFQISSVPDGNYKVKIAASGLSEWTAADVPASANARSNLVVAVLQVAPQTTTLIIGLSPQELANE